MQGSENMSDKGESYFSYLKYVAPFGLFVSFLYNLSYWGSFNINVYQYAGLSELVSSAVQPLIYSLAAIIVFFIWNTFLQPELETLDRIFYILISISFVSIALYFILMKSQYSHVIGLVFLSETIYQKYFYKEHDEKKLISFFVRAFVIISFASYSVGIEKSNDIKKGIEYFALDKSDDSLRFVGKAGAFYFFFDPITHAIRYDNIVKHKEMTLYPCSLESCNHPIKKQRACIDRTKMSIIDNPAIYFGWKLLCPEPEVPKVDVK